MSENDKKKQPEINVAVLQGPQDVPAFVTDVIRSDRAGIIQKLLAVADTDFDTQTDFPGLTKEQRENSVAAIKVFAVFVATLIDSKPLPIFDLRTVRVGKEAGTVH